jgi:CRP-like cAMP-binding protein
MAKFVSDSKIDLRGVPIWQHAAQVCQTVATLRDEHGIQIICDYEPQPLRRHVYQNFPDRIVWSHRRVADGRWEVLLHKASADAPADPVLQFLNRCPVFIKAKEATRVALARIAAPKTVGKNQVIAGQGMDWPFLAVVKEGRILAIAESVEGREQVLYELLSGETFGEHCLFDGGATFARFMTCSDSAELLLFSRADVVHCAETDTAFGWALAESMTQRTRTIVDVVKTHISKSTAARVAAVLLPHAPMEFGLSPIDVESLPALRLSRVAAAAGTVKEVAARALATLENGGAIRRAHGRITHMDRAKLYNFT